MSESPPVDKPIDLEMEKLKIDRESKSVNFSNLPTDVLNLIIDELELKERLILRKVSSGLRDLVARKKSILTEIRFIFCEDHIRADFNSTAVVYADHVDCRKPKIHYRFCESKVIRSANYPQMALDDLKSVLNVSKLQLDVLGVQFYTWSNRTHLRHYSERIETIVTSSLNHTISTKTFETSAESAHHILAVLPYLTPGTLHGIEFTPSEASWTFSDAEFDRIADLEQWKQAKRLNLKFAGGVWPMKHLMHFEEIHIFDWCLSAEGIREWIDLFSKSKHFVKCELVTTDGFKPGQIQDYISDGVSILISEEEFVNPIYLIEHPILDDPNQYLEIKVWPMDERITFNKLARQSS